MFSFIQWIQVVYITVTDGGAVKTHHRNVNSIFHFLDSFFVTVSSLSSLLPGTHTCLSRHHEKTREKGECDTDASPWQRDGQTERCSWSLRCTAGLISSLCGVWNHEVPGWRQWYFCPSLWSGRSLSLMHYSQMWHQPRQILSQQGKATITQELLAEKTWRVLDLPFLIISLRWNQRIKALTCMKLKYIWYYCINCSPRQCWDTQQWISDWCFECQQLSQGSWTQGKINHTQVNTSTHSLNTKTNNNVLSVKCFYEVRELFHNLSFLTTLVEGNHVIGCEFMFVFSSFLFCFSPIIGNLIAIYHFCSPQAKDL